MQFYERVLQRVNGALAAHYGRALSESYKSQVLGFVYSQKYEFQLRFDDMQVVGRSAGGHVEAVMSPTGLIKKIRVSPSVASLPNGLKTDLVSSAVTAGKKKGNVLLQEAERQVYGLFLRDIKPWVYGIRDNPEFFTIPEDAIETDAGILAPDWLTPEHIHRTIPFAKWKSRTAVHDEQQSKENTWLSTSEGHKWSQTLAGREYLENRPESLPRGAPGRTVSVDKSNKNVAYDGHAAKRRHERTKATALFERWITNPVTANTGEAFDKVLLSAMSEDLRVAAARTDWTITRADDRARAKRVAQDKGLEPHYQNAPSIDLRHHWFVRRRDFNAEKFYDYDVFRPTLDRRPYIAQWTRRRFHPFCLLWSTEAPDMEKWATHKGQPFLREGRGQLLDVMQPTESWQSRLNFYPDATAKF
eukprot:TRINITY_DN2051_c4_g1_i2.p1 TRINITY_DN2051_c4_g1~~TRINITY_DN2051_c4_g1_i2.p1  ORF type:complete len:416 (+),score=45.46 TRINITY_DN2051_c4_g1_i2:68-1315(+)